VPKKRLGLIVLAEIFAIHRLQAKAPFPEGLLEAEPVFLARTGKELSIVCPRQLPIDADRSSQPWRCFEVEGPLEFSMIGVLASLTETLATAGISVFAVSTFDTDYLLVKADQLEVAEAALKSAGHTVTRDL